MLSMGNGKFGAKSILNHTHVADEVRPTCHIIIELNWVF